MRPPLVRELFDERFSDILHEYPLAEQIAPDIRIAVGSGAIGLEHYLRDELLNSEHAYLRARYQAIPLYLQHVLWRAGDDYAPHPDNYDRLITEALRFDYVTFVTLNYDTILDRRLAIDRPIAGLGDYIGAGWSLIKLHGSVNWAREVIDSEVEDASHLIGLGVPARSYARDFAALGTDLELADDINLMPDGTLEELRSAPVRRTATGRYGLVASPLRYRALYYPALAVPLGAEDELICPDHHVEQVREFQRQSPEGLNLLVIGYSGIDQAVLDLLAWGGRRVRAIKVVNGNFELSMNAVRVFADRLGFLPEEDMAFDGGFNGFAQGPGLAEYLRALD